jgi:hypothetical protein
MQGHKTFTQCLDSEELMRAIYEPKLINKIFLMFLCEIYSTISTPRKQLKNKFWSYMFGGTGEENMYLHACKLL